MGGEPFSELKRLNLDGIKGLRPAVRAVSRALSETPSAEAGIPLHRLAMARP